MESILVGEVVDLWPILELVVNFKMSCQCVEIRHYRLRPTATRATIFCKCIKDRLPGAIGIRESFFLQKTMPAKAGGNILIFSIYIFRRYCSYDVIILNLLITKLVVMLRKIQIIMAFNIFSFFDAKTKKKT